MSRTVKIALAVASVALAVAAFCPMAVRSGALTGVVSCGGLALISLSLMRVVAQKRNPTQWALAVMAAMFVVRGVAVGCLTVAVIRVGASVFAFILAFFVLYFIFAALEGAYVRTLSRGTGKIA